MRRFLKSGLSLVLALAVMLSSSAVGLSEVNFDGLLAVKAEAANSGTCGENLVWSLDSKGVLTISGTGPMADYTEYSDTPWSGAKAVVIKNGVTSIGNCAFYGSDISSVTIPSSVKNIGEKAFYECKKLATVKLNKGIESIGFCAFVKCTNLKSIVLPDGIKNIASRAFDMCSKLESITIPDTVTALCSSSFRKTAYYNDSNKWENGKLYLNNYLLTANSSLTGNCEIKDGTRMIADDAFYYCESVTSITIPNSVEIIGEWAFYGCSGIESITIPDSVTKLGRRAFEGCVNLKTVKLSNSLKTIERELFWGCSSLESIEIPDSVTSIDASIFNDCLNIESITIPDSVTRIGDWSFAFRETAFYKNEDNWENGALYIGNHLIKVKDTIIGSYDVKPGTITIADSAFVNCAKLVSVSIPGSAKTIGDSAFENCKNLVSVSIADGVTSICDEAFIKCDFLKAVIIPESVTEIGEYAFGYNSQKGKNTDFVICGKIGTAAEAYANDNGFRFINSNHNHMASAWKTVQKNTVLLPGINVKECTKCRVTLEVEILPLITPDAPEVSVKNLENGVFVKWNKVKGADEYIVYRKAYDPETEAWSDWSKIADGITIGGYTDRNIKPATYYMYTVAARNAGGEGSYTSGAETYFITTPELVSLEHDFTDITFKWNKVDEATGYIVYRRNVSDIHGKWEAIAKTQDTTYVDENARTGINYKYTVRAFNGSYTSYFDESGLQTIMLLTPELRAIDCERAGVNIVWNVEGDDYCYIYRREYDAEAKKWSGWTRIASRAYGSSYTDETVKSGTYYIYTVKAISNKYGVYTVSGYEKPGLKICFLATPEIKSATSTKAGVKLHWNKIEGASGYKIYRRIGNAPWGTAIATVKGNSVENYVDKTAKKGITYTYTIRAYRGTTRSAYVRPGTTIKDKY